MAGPLPNARRERFVQEMAKGLDQSKAYTAAGFSGDKTQACRLAARPEVRARLAELLGRAADKAEITAARVLEELGKIGFSDVRKLYDPETGALKRIEELDDDAAACLSSVEVVTRRVAGGDRDEVEHVAKIRLWDKRAALVDIGKHLGMFTEKVEHTGKDGGPIEIADSDLARLIVFQLTKAAQ